MLVLIGALCLKGIMLDPVILSTKVLILFLKLKDE